MSEEQKGALIAKEHKETGTVSIKVYLRYAAACGNILVALVMLFQIVYHALLMAAAVVLSLWAQASTEFRDQVNATATTGNASIPVRERTLAVPK